MKILLISSLSLQKNRIDGVTIKSRILKQFLEEDTNLEIYSVDVDNWKKNFAKIIFEIFKYYNVCDKIVICSSSPGASIVLKFFYAIKNKKDIFYFVAGGSLAEMIKETNKYPLKIYKNLKKIYVETNQMYQEFRNLGLENVQQKNNFRKVSKEIKSKEVNDKKIKFVFYGRIVKEKGIEKAIQLINRLNEENYKVILDIYGQGNKEYIENLMKISCECISFKGIIIPDGATEYEILAGYDVFIFPTEHDGEGLPGALIDSYISGLAVLASKWKYAEEYIENGYNGLIFKYKDYEDMYKKATIMMDRNILDTFKENSKRKSEGFLVENVLDDFVKELERN